MVGPDIGPIDKSHGRIATLTTSTTIGQKRDRRRSAIDCERTKRPGAERIARAFAAAGGQSIAADAIDELVAADATPRPAPSAKSLLS